VNLADYEALVTLCQSKGWVAPSDPAEKDFLATLAAREKVDSEVALEWFAEELGFLPFGLPRATCANTAEECLRHYGRADDAEEPWLPFATLGPLLVMAHYNPAALSDWHVPRDLQMRVLVPEVQYRALQGDLRTRLEIQGLSTSEPWTPKPCPKQEGYLEILDWLLTILPYPVEEKERLERTRHQLMAAKAMRWQEYKVLGHGFAPAIHFLATNEFCFHPDHAPSQDYFPDSLLEKHAVYPLYCGKHAIYLLSEERYNFAFEDEWLSRGQDPVKWHPVLAEKEAIQAAIARNRGRSAVATTSVQVGEMAYSDVENLVEIDLAEVQRINPSSINATPEQVIHWVLYRTMALRASDLHVEKFYNTARFRARIDGELQTVHTCPEEQLPRFIGLIKNYANMGQRRQDAQDSRFSMSLGKRRIDCRVSAIPCRKDQQKLTIRFLDKLDGVKKLSELHLAPEQMEIFTEIMGRDQGLILITGPTGSGKTTTLYALLNSVNAENINIHTIEDPIEYEIEGLNQTQTDPVNGITFADGLRRLMRADPDVILIGECRDEETANAAINAALTGHLVLTTLHANDCLRAVTRLIAMNIPPYLLADSLALTQAQRLVRRLCNFCKRPTAITPEVRHILEINRVPLPDQGQSIYVPVGCPECHGCGYSGRLALMEMCPIDARLADLISRNAPQSEMRALAISRGVRTLYQQGLQQVLNGHTSMEEIACLSYTSLRNSDA
jgi:type II secretory ATPase GspE/PulE/Tfp pilus assembly ATPase PilB-like protein